jgi:hypothetical protein
MEISTYAAWEEEERQDHERRTAAYPGSVQYYADHRRELYHKRDKLFKRFPTRSLPLVSTPNMTMPADGAGTT